MLVRWYINDKPRETEIANAFKQGCASNVEIVHQSVTCIKGVDVVCMCGIKNLSVFNALRANGIPVIYFDKPYDRKLHGWRIAFNDHQPTDSMYGMRAGPDRAMANGWFAPNWRIGRTVLLAGSSEKFHTMKKLRLGPNEYAAWCVKRLRKLTDREIVYRPKPSWRNPVPIPGTTFSQGRSIADDLAEAHCLITYGSNACFEALLSGVPAIILGDGVTRSISSLVLEDVETPHYAHAKHAQQLLNNLAWFQWSTEEFKNGQAWDFIKRQIPCLT